MCSCQQAEHFPCVVVCCWCLQGFRSLLTDSQDASYLFNAVLDAVVDHTLPLVQVGRCLALLASVFEALYWTCLLSRKLLSPRHVK